MGTTTSTASTYRVSRVEVSAEPLLDGADYDYADAFEVRTDRADAHTAEQWARACLDQSPRVVTALIRLVHGRVAKFQLDPDPTSILGWRTLASTPDVLHLQTSGPMARADIVARRAGDRVATLTTFLTYHHPRTARMWRVVGPLHRRIAPYLLTRAARHLTA